RKGLQVVSIRAARRNAVSYSMRLQLVEDGSSSVRKLDAKEIWHAEFDENVKPGPQPQGF
ncbi:MAG: hypothetical protein WAM08_13315, partial [Candidatus Acidiferrales bacterium]